MTLVLIVVMGAVLVILGVRQAVRGSAAAVAGPEDLLQRTNPVDMAAFRNLVDREEDRYLRMRLPWWAWLRVRIARQLAAIGYVHCVAANAAIFIRFAQAAKTSNDSGIREAAQQLLGLAVETRIIAVAALLQLYVSLAVPWWQPSLRAAAIYGELRSALESMIRLQRPELATRIASGF